MRKYIFISLALVLIGTVLFLGLGEASTVTQNYSSLRNVSTTDVRKSVAVAESIEEQDQGISSATMIGDPKVNTNYYTGINEELLLAAYECAVKACYPNQTVTNSQIDPIMLMATTLTETGGNATTSCFLPLWNTSKVKATHGDITLDLFYNYHIGMAIKDGNGATIANNDLGPGQMDELDRTVGEGYDVSDIRTTVKGERENYIEYFGSDSISYADTYGAGKNGKGWSTYESIFTVNDPAYKSERSLDRFNWQHIMFMKANKLTNALIANENNANSSHKTKIELKTPEAVLAFYAIGHNWGSAIYTDVDSTDRSHFPTTLGWRKYVEVFNNEYVLNYIRDRVEEQVSAARTGGTSIKCMYTRGDTSTWLKHFIEEGYVKNCRVSNVADGYANVKLNYPIQSIAHYYMLQILFGGN